MAQAPILTRRALNRATLARQLLLERSPMSVTEVLEHLVGMQAQTPHTAYVGLWTRLLGFQPDQLSDLLVDRQVVRIALMRATIFMVTARDAWALRPLVQVVHDRMHRGQFGRRLQGVDTAAVVAAGRAFLDVEPRTFKALGEHLLERWPEHDRLALEMTVRTGVPLVQVPPRGLWGRSGAVAHTSIEAWLGNAPAAWLTVDGLVLRYLRAFGPASVMDAQMWCGLTRLKEVFERLRPGLVVFRDEDGRELFDLPDAPRPDPDVPAPPRFMYDYENLFLSYADRTRTLIPERVRHIVVRPNEVVSTFLIDGFVAGTWQVERERRHARLVVRPLVPLAADDEAALLREGAALVAFVADDATTRDVAFGPAWPSPAG
ncbi:MAG: winged helix DNA-binding domain-containing protein [Chloroflexota bacterium]|nr:winged helix DNA-binding domain-containing protein [Chloroflexota bacterium]